MLTSAAFNALLKTLEEPPEHVKFIFATTEPQKVLPTILSRCQRFDLRRIPALLIAAHLQKIAANEEISLADDAAEAIARGAEGGLRDAESMLDQLVAFCGETIALEDVLGIFGFTAPETVSRLAGHIIGQQTSEALAVARCSVRGRQGPPAAAGRADRAPARSPRIPGQPRGGDDGARRRADRGVQGASTVGVHGTSAGAHRRLRGRGRPDEVGSEQETAFRNRAHQGGSEPRPEHAHGSDRRPDRPPRVGTRHRRPQPGARAGSSSRATVRDAPGRTREKRRLHAQPGLGKSETLRRATGEHAAAGRGEAGGSHSRRAARVARDGGGRGAGAYPGRRRGAPGWTRRSAALAGHDSGDPVSATADHRVGPDRPAVCPGRQHPARGIPERPEDERRIAQQSEHPQVPRRAAHEARGASHCPEA